MNSQIQVNTAKSGTTSSPLTIHSTLTLTTTPSSAPTFVPRPDMFEYAPKFQLDKFSMTLEPQLESFSTGHLDPAIFLGLDEFSFQYAESSNLGLEYTNTRQLSDRVFGYELTFSIPNQMKTPLSLSHESYSFSFPPRNKFHRAISHLRLIRLPVPMDELLHICGTRENDTSFSKTDIVDMSLPLSDSVFFLRLEEGLSELEDEMKIVCGYPVSFAFPNASQLNIFRQVVFHLYFLNQMPNLHTLCFSLHPRFIDYSLLYPTSLLHIHTLHVDVPKTCTVGNNVIDKVLSMVFPNIEYFSYQLTGSGPKIDIFERFGNLKFPKLKLFCQLTPVRIQPTDSNFPVDTIFFSQVFFPILRYSDLELTLEQEQERNSDSTMDSEGLDGFPSGVLKSPFFIPDPVYNSEVFQMKRLLHEQEICWFDRFVKVPISIQLQSFFENVKISRSSYISMKPNGRNIYSKIFSLGHIYSNCLQTLTINCPISSILPNFGKYLPRLLKLSFSSAQLDILPDITAKSLEVIEFSTYNCFIQSVDSQFGNLKSLPQLSFLILDGCRITQTVIDTFDKMKTNNPLIQMMCDHHIICNI